MRRWPVSIQLLPGLVVMALGLGAVIVGMQNAANAGVLRAIASTMSADGRFRTHSQVRLMFSVVLELASRPSMQLQPSHHADDIGDRFGVPSSLMVLIRTTGVPKYRIGNSLRTCITVSLFGFAT
jgi:hypothetical protein